MSKLRNDHVFTSESVSEGHPDKLGAKLTCMSQEQADYIGVPVDGPYKPDHYRY
jgi:adenosylhomocysteinase